MKYKNAQNELFVDPILANHDDLVLLTDAEFDAQLAINNPPPTYSYLSDATVELNHLYDAAMLTLQNGYSNEEVKTFAVKQDAINDYVAGGIAGLSAENRVMMEALTGSTDNLVLSAKLDNMVAASATFKNYLALIERTRDIHIDQLVEGQDNSPIVASLSAAYAALGG